MSTLVDAVFGSYRNVRFGYRDIQEDNGKRLNV